MTLRLSCIVTLEKREYPKRQVPHGSQSRPAQMGKRKKKERKRKTQTVKQCMYRLDTNECGSQKNSRKKQFPARAYLTLQKISLDTPDFTFFWKENTGKPSDVQERVGGSFSFVVFLIKYGWHLAGIVGVFCKSWTHYLVFPRRGFFFTR